MEYRNAQGLTEKEFLASYKPGDYDRPSVTVDMLIFAVNDELDTLKILMIRRKNHPYINCWALPGGFVDIDESLEHAALRELEEETGLHDIYMEQLYTFGNPERDPRMRVISTAYMALIRENYETAVAGDDAAEVAWFSIRQKGNEVQLIGEHGEMLLYSIGTEQICRGGVVGVQEIITKPEKSGIAFDHEKIIHMGLTRLRNKAEYTNILFGLMPEEFTLPELQCLYETVLGKNLYKANFRNKYKEYLEPVGKKKEKEGTKRSPELYRFKME